MDSEAFNTYCITCDQLCSENSIYCSSACKEQDEQTSKSIPQSFNADIVSPLLTPSSYQQTQNMPMAETIGSPLLLPARLTREGGLVDLSLNYSLSQPVTSSKIMSSTSQNYRLWLSRM